jgi:hypothetical protein
MSKERLAFREEKLWEEAENRERLIQERTSRGKEIVQIKIDPNKKIFDYVENSTEG